MEHSRTNEKCRAAGVPRARGVRRQCELGEMGLAQIPQVLGAMGRSPDIILRVEGSPGEFVSRGEA